MCRKEKKKSIQILPLKHHEKNCGKHECFFIIMAGAECSSALALGNVLTFFRGAAIKLHEAAKRCLVMRLSVK